ncbi:MAG: LodA/GoxA family CTQ-dependent oxidase [Crocinitomicaceae bacterium]|nr:LodA/GoxA family CTQ-dependent oxidase [Crocinitomicaceae bacterium]
MNSENNPKFRIYPSIGIARLGNGRANKEDVVFSPEVPWENIFDTDKEYISEDGALKKQAQRFYIYRCDDQGNPIERISPDEFDIEWTAEVANKKPFWYDFNNSLDLSVQLENHNNLSNNFFDERIAPGISASLRNPNVLNEGLRKEGAENFRKELINSPKPVSVNKEDSRRRIKGMFPFVEEEDGLSRIAAKMNTTSKKVNLGTLEYDDGALIFYGGDGVSASLNASDLNTDFADNSNWYDDICDGRITAKIISKSSGEVVELDNAKSAAWIATAPPDYAPQIQPISTMYDLICGAADERYIPELSLIFPLFFRLYRMQWVNMGDFLSPSFKETIDKLTYEGKFKYIFEKSSNPEEARKVREEIFNLFRDPEYNYNNEPIIPSKDKTDLTNLGSGTDELKLPYYPGDGINYPGSPAQWFAIPPMLYNQLKEWRDGNFATPESFDFADINEMGEYYRQQFISASKDEKKQPLLMTRAVLETLYGGGFHPGVELTWPMRHSQIYRENSETFRFVSSEGIYEYGFYGLREVRINSASKEEQERIFYKSFGLLMTPEDLRESMSPDHEKHWLWKITPGDLTKWMGIPWQSDAGSCQAVFTDSQYPVPAWWAANLPIDVLTEESFDKIQDDAILPDTRRNIYANRLPWLQTTDTGFVGYHAEGGYMNGLIAMVYQWKDIGVVTGRRMDKDLDGVPEIVYVSYNGKQK